MAACGHIVTGVKIIAVPGEGGCAGDHDCAGGLVCGSCGEGGDSCCTRRCSPATPCKQVGVSTHHSIRYVQSYEGARLFVHAPYTL